MQNFGGTNKEHYGMLWYFWSGQFVFFYFVLALTSAVNNNFHDFPGWKMKFLNSMTCANPNFNYYSSNTDHVLKTYQLLMALHYIQKSGKVYIFTVQAHLPTTQTNYFDNACSQI